MKKFLKYFIFLTLASPSFGQPTKDKSPPIKTQVQIIIDTLKTSTRIDTLKVQAIQTKKDSEPSNMPWIAALIVGALTVAANYIIAKINKDTAIRNIDTQIKTSTEAANKQIESTKEIAIKQITNSQELASQSYNATLKSQNRQQWINTVRDTLSEFFTQAKLLNAEFQETQKNKPRQVELHEKVTLQRAKLSLLLNPELPTHKKLIDAIMEVLTTLDLHMSNSKNNMPFDNVQFMANNEAVIKAGRDLLYSEWRKIQNLDESKQQKT